MSKPNRALSSTHPFARLICETATVSPSSSSPAAPPLGGRFGRWHAPLLRPLHPRCSSARRPARVAARSPPASSSPCWLCSTAGSNDGAHHRLLSSVGGFARRYCQTALHKVVIHLPSPSPSRPASSAAPPRPTAAPPRRRSRHGRAVGRGRRSPPLTSPLRPDLAPPLLRRYSRQGRAGGRGTRSPPPDADATQGARACAPPAADVISPFQASSVVLRLAVPSLYPRQAAPRLCLSLTFLNVIWLVAQGSWFPLSTRWVTTKCFPFQLKYYHQMLLLFCSTTKVFAVDFDLFFL